MYPSFFLDRGMQVGRFGSVFGQCRPQAYYWFRRLKRSHIIFFFNMKKLKNQTD